MSRIETPGFYDDIPEAEYHADPCKRPSLSSGVLSTIIDKTLADAKAKHPRLNPDLEPEDKTQYDLGSVAHELLLGRGAGIVVIEADDWRKKDTQAQRADALAAGKQPCLSRVYDQAEAMAAAARQYLADDPENYDAFTNGVPEQVAACQLPTASGAIWCRSRLDWRMNDAPRIYDYKTFAPGPDPDGFVKYLFREARDIQDPFYSTIFAELEGCDWDQVEFRYVVQDPNPPYVLSVVQLDEHARQFSRDRMDWGMNRWAAAGRAGRWEGYRSRTYYVGAPTYEMTAWEAKRMADELADALDQRAADAENGDD